MSENGQDKSNGAGYGVAGDKKFYIEDFELDPILQRFPRESHTAYNAFILWRDTPRKDRSMMNIAMKHGTSKNNIVKFIARWKWRDRMAAWENHIAQHILRDLVDRGLAANERHINTAKLLAGKGIMKLKDYDPEKLTVSEAVRLLLEGIRIERDGFGLHQHMERRLSEEVEEKADQVTGFVLGQDDEETEDIDHEETTEPDEEAEDRLQLPPSGEES